jgi:hypothetical protein
MIVILGAYVSGSYDPRRDWAFWLCLVEFLWSFCELGDCIMPGMESLEIARR